MQTSGDDGFSGAAPVHTIALGNAIGGAAMTGVTVEHLPKVIWRPVYYGPESSCQVPIIPHLFSTSESKQLTQYVLSWTPSLLGELSIAGSRV